MVKIYPHLAFPVDIGVVEDKIVPYLTKEQESFTIWMKSLVFHSKGCTVFDSKGNLIYRVDNYNSKSCSNEVYFMDSYGKILFTLRQKKSVFFKSWEGYNSTGTRFRLSKIFKILPRDSSYKVVMGSRIVDGGDQQSCYKIVNRGSVFAIKDGSGRLMAEVKNKLSDISGLDLGEDVLTMMVEPQLDHSIIMGDNLKGKHVLKLIKCWHKPQISRLKLDFDDSTKMHVEKLGIVYPR